MAPATEEEEEETGETLLSLYAENLEVNSASIQTPRVRQSTRREEAERTLLSLLLLLASVSARAAFFFARRYNLEMLDGYRKTPPCCSITRTTMPRAGPKAGGFREEREAPQRRGSCTSKNPGLPAIRKDPSKRSRESLHFPILGRRLVQETERTEDAWMVLGEELDLSFS